MLSRQLVLTLLRFAAVGLTVMLFCMGLNAVFSRFWGPQAGFLISYPPSVALHFLLNKWWTFGSRSNYSARQISEYLVMVGITFVIQWLVFTAIVRTTSTPSWMAVGIANATQMIITFLGMQFRIFRADSLNKDTV